MPIPRILHQTWKTEDIPEEWEAHAQSWRRLHPTWDYRLWTDAANRSFVAEHYPAFLPAYDSYSYAIQRADAVRYCLLHHFGGVYADLDIECLQPIDGLMGESEFIAVLEPAEQGAWLGKTSLPSNAFMASPPGHPLLDAVLDALIRNPSPGLTHRDVLETTGPLMLDAVLHEYEDDDVTVLPSHVVSPYPKGAPELQTLRTDTHEARALRSTLVRNGTFAVHYWANSWVGTLAGRLNNPRPFEVEGFTFYKGWDSPGHDIANVGRDVPRAAAECLSIEGAVAFNTDGFVKDLLLPRDHWLPMGGGGRDEGLYVRSAQGPAAIVRRLLTLPGRIAARLAPVR